MTKPYERQYEAWGVAVQTSQVRGAHLANGIVQLLRLFPETPSWTQGALNPADYEKKVTNELNARFTGVSGAELTGGWKLSDAARALCVTSTKEGPLSLADAKEDGPAFFLAGRAHIERFVEQHYDTTQTDRVHATLAAALNADGRVYASGGSDPTTPSLSFAGYTSTHTLKGMHAATFLGLLSKTPSGAEVIRELYNQLRRQDDPHTQLIHRMQLDVAVTTNADASFEGAFPLPSGTAWDELATRTARLAKRLLAWNRRAASKPDALMAMVDLASLLLFLRLVQWRPAGTDDDGRSRLLLMVSGRRRGSEAITRAQQSLLAACATVDFLAEEADLLRDPAEKKAPIYLPSIHARNLGAAGGWLFPLDSRGAPKRWFSPGHRQLRTLVHALLDEGEELAWADFADRALKELGLVLGGVSEAKMAAALGLGGGANSVREAGKLNREHMVALGLARQESDNVILVDGGGR